MPSFAVLPISTAGNLHLFSVKSADLNLRFEKKKSDGEKVANPKQFNRLYKKLRRKQKARPAVLKEEPLPPTSKPDYYATDQPHEHTKQWF